MQKLEPTPGSEISSVIQTAIHVARKENETVEFVFNGVSVTVDGESDPLLILRDWGRGMDGCLGDKPSVGPHPPTELSPEEIAKDAAIRKEKDRRLIAFQKSIEQNYESKMMRLQDALKSATPIQLKDTDAWRRFLEDNQDGYVRRAMRFADDWARLMQQEIDRGQTIAQCADATARLADDDGITGAMYGFALSILGMCWVHGDELIKG